MSYSTRRHTADQSCYCHCCAGHLRHTARPSARSADYKRPSEVNKYDAARYLNICVRTLQRYQAKGLIKGRYLPGGKYDLVFEQAELDRCQKALESVSSPKHVAAPSALPSTRPAVTLAHHCFANSRPCSTDSRLRDRCADGSSDAPVHRSGTLAHRPD